jgi:hypothetical protein
MATISALTAVACIAVPRSLMGQQRWLEEHRVQSHVTLIGDRWPDTLATHSRLIEAVGPNKKRPRSITARRSEPPQRNGKSRRGKPWRLLCGQSCLMSAPSAESFASRTAAISVSIMVGVVVLILRVQPRFQSRANHHTWHRHAACSKRNRGCPFQLRHTDRSRQ